MINCANFSIICGTYIIKFELFSGAIVNVASLASLRPAPFLNIYAASKVGCLLMINKLSNW